MYRIFRTILFISLVIPVRAQEIPPSDFVVAEKNQTTFVFQRADVITDPPEVEVRAMAEWEELGALAVPWDLGWPSAWKDMLADIIRYSKEEVEVLLFCSGRVAFDIPGRVTHELAQRGVDTENVTLIEQNFDHRIWIRDYAAHTLYRNEVDSLVLVDWLYEPEFGNADEYLPSTMAGYFEVPLYATTRLPHQMKLDGGNFLSDGLGLALSSTHIFDDNILPARDIDNILLSFMGVRDYIKMEKLDYDVIHHIDMHLKLLDEENILVGQYPPGVADGPKIEANLSWLLDNFKTSFGTDFKIHRIPMPQDEDGNYPHVNSQCSKLGKACYYTYTNALFVNNTILVPTYFDGNGTDAEALNIWRQLMPGYKIIGIDCSEIIRDYGALHCVAKEIGVKKPLWIVHKQLENTCADHAPIVRAKIKHRSGIKSAIVYFNDQAQPPFFSKKMKRNAQGEWEAALPSFPPGTKVYYYIEATAFSGKVQFRPLPAPAATWTYTVDCVSKAAEAPQQIFNTAIGVRIFPNPVTAAKLVNIEVTAAPGISLKIELYNIWGERQSIIFSGKQDRFVTLHKLRTDALRPGVYYVSVQWVKGTVGRKLIITE